eukprot:m.813153 g.813153  ORF g.813153 m.813153 type:complete len:55 (+) comp59356_c0_seq3:2449-2613(+)
MFLYEQDVVEDASFLDWREELNDSYPGKGEALVELNEYLNWLSTADEEDEEEDD